MKEMIYSGSLPTGAEYNCFPRRAGARSLSSCPGGLCVMQPACHLVLRMLPSSLKLEGK